MMSRAGPLHLYSPIGDDSHPSLPSPLPSGIHHIHRPHARHLVPPFQRLSLALHSYQPRFDGLR